MGWTSPAIVDVVQVGDCTACGRTHESSEQSYEQVSTIGVGVVEGAVVAHGQIVWVLVTVSVRTMLAATSELAAKMRTERESCMVSVDLEDKMYKLREKSSATGTTMLRI